MGNFDFCIDILLREEGGYCDDPNDPGGETNFGISKKQYPDLDIRNIDRAQAIAIYHKDYWTPMCGDDMACSIALMVFNYAVNRGIYTATRYLQMVAGVEVDLVIGPITLAAINAIPPPQLITKLRAAMDEGYRLCFNFSTYGVAWLSRLDRITMASFRMETMAQANIIERGGV